MKLEDVENLWSIDCKINRTELDGESLKIPELHNKYYKIYIREKVQMKSEENEYNELYKVKWEYYNGKMDKAELDARGWEQFPLILNKDLNTYISADKDIIQKLLKLTLQREKVEFLESIIKTLATRGFLIKNAIEFIKFNNGTH